MKESVDLCLLQGVSKEIDGCDMKCKDGLMVPLSNKELLSWATPWKNALILNNRKIYIIDLHDDYYQVVFSSEEDYKFALYKTPWMVVDHYLIVQ
ncbi:hypothetical protein CR513_08381, partial [Mucuna pruriens]